MTKVKPGDRIVVRSSVPVWGGSRGTVTDDPVSHPDMEFIVHLEGVGNVAFMQSEVDLR